MKHGKIKREENSRYGVAIESLKAVVIEGNDVVSPGTILLLDPRGVVRGKESGEIYTPRPHMHEFPSEAREWMESNPDWPERLNLEDQKTHPDRAAPQGQNHGSE